MAKAKVIYNFKIMAMQSLLIFLSSRVVLA